MTMNDKETKDMKSDTCRIYKLHIRYIVFICLLICLFVILVAPNHVNDEAFRNFSFAATITSIVLAVVSIVYSFYSSGGLTMSIGEMKQVEQDLEEEIRNIPDLKNHVSQTVESLKENILKALDENRLASDSKTDELKEAVQTVQTEVSKFRTNPEKEDSKGNNKINNQSSNYFNYNSNSILGNLFVYSLYKAWTTKQPLNIASMSKIISSDATDYFKGYVVALAMSTPKFLYSNDEDFTTITIKGMDSSYFCLDKIESLIIDSRADEATKESNKTKMKAIEEFFSPNKKDTASIESSDSKE